MNTWYAVYPRGDKLDLCDEILPVAIVASETIAHKISKLYAPHGEYLEVDYEAVEDLVERLCQT